MLLDEYVGLPPDHPESYRTFIRSRARPIRSTSRAARLYGPDVWADDLAAACARYDRLLAELGGVDVQLLGHRVRRPHRLQRARVVARLADADQDADRRRRARDNARFFASLDDVPHHVVTQGLATIGEARHVVLVATGAAKAAPIARAVEGPLTAMCPASVLQLHPHATVVVDEAAAAGLQLADYYRVGVRRQAVVAAPVSHSLRLESWFVPSGERRRRRCGCASSTPARRRSTTSSWRSRRSCS